MNEVLKDLNKNEIRENITPRGDGNYKQANNL